MKNYFVMAAMLLSSLSGVLQAGGMLPPPQPPTHFVVTINADGAAIAHWDEQDNVTYYTFETSDQSGSVGAGGNATEATLTGPGRYPGPFNPYNSENFRLTAHNIGGEATSYFTYDSGFQSRTIHIPLTGTNASPDEQSVSAIISTNGNFLSGYSLDMQGGEQASRSWPIYNILTLSGYKVRVNVNNALFEPSCEASSKIPVSESTRFDFTVKASSGDVPGTCEVTIQP